MPTNDDVNKAVQKFDEENGPTEWLLTQLFQKYPLNTDASEVLVKTKVLNVLYNAGVLAVDTVASHITTLVGLDSCIASGSPDAVYRIANVQIKQRKFCFPSFASKYCSWHNPSAYPIFDKNVRTCLQFHNKQKRFATFTLDELWEYPTFLKVVIAFHSSYGLDNSFKFKQLDKWLWYCGAELEKMKRMQKP